MGKLPPQTQKEYGTGKKRHRIKRIPLGQVCSTVLRRMSAKPHVYFLHLKTGKDARDLPRAVLKGALPNLALVPPTGHFAHTQPLLEAAQHSVMSFVTELP